MTVAQVEALVSRDAPHLAGVPITSLAHGWDNILFRLGEGWLARFPRRALAVALVQNEVRWLPELAPRLPLPIPRPVVVGEPGEGFPWPWTIVPWIEGIPAAETTDVDVAEAATDLGSFLGALHVPAPEQAPPNPYRGVPLPERDEATRHRIARLAELTDVEGIRACWEDALEAPGHHGASVWLHGDLHPGNVIVSEGRMAGIIDFGDITAGDPATDLSAMWTVLGGECLDRFEEAYGGIDPATRMRAKGWALSLGLAYLASSADNPTMGDIGSRALEAVLASG